MSELAIFDLSFGKNTKWRNKGACNGWVPQKPKNGRQGVPHNVNDPFFDQSAKVQRKAAEFCKEVCPMLVQCGHYALDKDERYGVWGGMTERDREKLQKARGFQRLRKLEPLQITSEQ